MSLIFKDLVPVQSSVCHVLKGSNGSVSQPVPYDVGVPHQWAHGYKILVNIPQGKQVPILEDVSEPSVHYRTLWMGCYDEMYTPTPTPFHWPSVSYTSLAVPCVFLKASTAPRAGMLGIQKVKGWNIGS